MCTFKNSLLILLAVVVFAPGISRARLIGVELVASGLSMPVAMTHAGDGSGRLFITLQTGQIVIYDGNQVLPAPYLDIAPLLACCGERGLLSTAFHPEYRINGLFYVNYTNSDGDTVIARYRVSSNPYTADPGSAFILMTVPQPFSNHNGGQLHFGPDGFLYIGMGDGGSGGDPLNNAQDLATLLGKILRIDVDSGSPYTIPPDNPFIENPDALDEIWALGLRNPWRFSFDRLTGDLFIADVGQNLWEEINFQTAISTGGENYGWRKMEGKHCFNPAEDCNDGSLTLPILEYNHSLGCSVTGGYRYRGDMIRQLAGSYIFADYCSGRIWEATENAPLNWSFTELLDTDFLISAFGENEAGEILFARYSGTNGEIYRIAPVLAISPPSGPYVSTQNFDLVLILKAPGLSITGGNALFDGVDVTDFLSACFQEGTLVEGGQTFRCPGLAGSSIGKGTHTLEATINLSNGTNVSNSVIWEVGENVEP